MKSKVISNYIYNLSYEILSMVLPIFTVPYVSRVLGASQLGKYYYVTAIVTYFGIFAVLGTVDYGQREIAKRQSDKEKRSTFSHGRSIEERPVDIEAQSLIILRLIQ